MFLVSGSIYCAIWLYGRYHSNYTVCRVLITILFLYVGILPEFVFIVHYQDISVTTDVTTDITTDVTTTTDADTDVINSASHDLIISTVV